MSPEMLSKLLQLNIEVNVEVGRWALLLLIERLTLKKCFFYVRIVRLEAERQQCEAIVKKLGRQLGRRPCCKLLCIYKNEKANNNNLESNFVFSPWQLVC